MDVQDWAKKFAQEEQSLGRIAVVSVESPYSAASPEEIAENVAYAERAMLDSLQRGEGPLLSHLLYPRVLKDAHPDERRHGLEASHAWRRKCDLIAFYIDRGFSSGMKEALDLAQQNGIKIDIRSILK